MQRKIKNYIIFALVGFFVTIFFSSCIMVQTFHIVNEQSVSKLFIRIYNPGDDHLLIDDNFESDAEIENFEFISGLIKIGNYEINLDEKNNRIYFGILTRSGSTIMRYSKGYNEVYQKFDEPIDTEKVPDYPTLHYLLSFEKDLNAGDKRKIRSEYKKNNRKVSFCIKYNIVINGEIIASEFAEEYNLVETEKKYFDPKQIFWI